jgi:hypothetical protein
MTIFGASNFDVGLVVTFGIFFYNGTIGNLDEKCSGWLYIQWLHWMYHHLEFMIFFL